MIRLPKLMLGDDLPRLVKIATAIADDYSSIVECNAERLVTAEPVALCLLAASFAQLERRGQHARIRGLRPEVRENLERLDVLADWLREDPLQTPNLPPDAQGDLRACRVATPEQANHIAHALSREIAAFIPSDDFDAVIETDPTLVRYRAIEQPLDYVITELLDRISVSGSPSAATCVFALRATLAPPLGPLGFRAPPHPPRHPDDLLPDIKGLS